MMETLHRLGIPWTLVKTYRLRKLRDSETVISTLQISAVLDDGKV